MAASSDNFVLRIDDTCEVVAYTDNVTHTVSEPARATVFHKGDILYVRKPKN